MVLNIVHVFTIIINVITYYVYAMLVHRLTKTDYNVVQTAFIA